MITTYTNTTSTLAYVEGNVVVGTFDTSNVKLELAPPDLSSSNEIACPPLATHVADTPALRAGPDFISPQTTDQGLSIDPFDSGWAEGAVQLTVASDPPTAITAAQISTTALVVWSTDTSCHVESVMDRATGTGTSASMPCPAPRLAAGNGDVALVFESASGIAREISAANALDVSAAIQVAPTGASPRVNFDGANYWLAYRDGVGDIMVGYLATDGSVQMVAMQSDAYAAAYTLAIVGGEPWLFAMDTTGLTATKFCVP